MPRRRRGKERGRQLARILRLIRKFEHARTGFTMKELAKDMKISRRTLYRDLNALEGAGFRLETDGGRGETKKWRFTQGQRRSLSSTFTENELLSLYFCHNLLE
ncbi:MAG: helix-turn-helix transcriptional regulator, partial [Planctomycetota bacterium]